MVNLNKLAAKVTMKEGLKKSISIAQVKEIMHVLFHELRSMTLDDIVGILKRYK